MTRNDLIELEDDIFRGNGYYYKLERDLIYEEEENNKRREIQQVQNEIKSTIQELIYTVCEEKPSENKPLYKLFVPSRN